MYTIVLMAAMSTAPEIPDLGRRCRGDRGCRGNAGWCGCRGHCRGGGWCGGWCGGCHGCGGAAGPYMRPARPAEPVPAPKKKVQAEAPATLIVQLPADARLTIDKQPTNLTSAQRVFVSPPLEPGKEYYYVLRAEVPRDGQAVSQRVTVRAGQETQVRLEIPATVAAASP